MKKFTYLGINLLCLMALFEAELAIYPGDHAFKTYIIE